MELLDWLTLIFTIIGVISGVSFAIWYARWEDDMPDAIVACLCLLYILGGFFAGFLWWITLPLAVLFLAALALVKIVK